MSVPADNPVPADNLALAPDRPPAPKPRSGAAWFALTALVSAGLFAATYWAFVLTETGQRLENVALLGAELVPPVDRQGSIDSLSGISVASFAIVILGVLAIGAATRRRGFGVVVAGIMATSVIISQLLKELLPRPPLVEGPAWLLRNSFPSGHATVAAAIAIGVLLIVPGRLRWLALPLGAFYAALIGQATQVTGWHRMSGAVAGAFIVIAVAGAVLAVLALAGRVQTSRDGLVHRGVLRAMLAVAGGAAILGALVFVLPLAFPVLAVPDDAGRAFTHTALQLAAFGTTILAFTAFGFVIAPYSLGRRPDPPSPAAGTSEPGSA